MSRPIIRRTVQISLVLLSLAFSMASPTMGVLRSGDIAHMTAGMPVPEALVVDLAQAFADRDPPGIYMARNKGWAALLVLRRIPDSSAAADRHSAIRRCEGVAFSRLVREALSSESFDQHMPLPEGRYAALLRTIAVRRMRVEIEKGSWARSGADREWVWALLAVPDASIRACEEGIREIPEDELHAIYLEEVMARAESLSSQGEFGESLAWFEEALRLQGENAPSDYILRYAHVAAGAGQRKKSEGILRTLSATRSSDLSPYQWDVMGDLHEALGNASEARECYERALSLQSPPPLGSTIDALVSPP